MQSKRRDTINYTTSTTQKAEAFTACAFPFSHTLENRTSINTLHINHLRGGYCNRLNIAILIILIAFVSLHASAGETRYPITNTEESTDTIIYVEEQAILYPVVEPQGKPLRMALYTNMLFDALATPNLGVEFYLGKHWSIAANYMHAWWSKDAKHRYWRIYGGDLNVRYWFGNKMNNAFGASPLAGHHLGLYAQALTYDFEFGGKAHMGGKPGGNIFDHPHIGGGIEYGYSLPVAKRLNIDFSISVGYIGGRVYEFVPDADRYLWTATKNKNWFGPTKLEISLVWLIGHGNTNAKYNKEKGGEL